MRFRIFSWALIAALAAALSCRPVPTAIATAKPLPPALTSKAQRVATLPHNLPPCQPIWVSNNEILLFPANPLAKTWYLFDTRKKTIAARTQMAVLNSPKRKHAFMVAMYQVSSAIVDYTADYEDKMERFWKQHTQGKKLLIDVYLVQPACEIWFFVYDSASATATPMQRLSSWDALPEHPIVDLWIRTPDPSDDFKPTEFGTMRLNWTKEMLKTSGGYSTPTSIALTTFYEMPDRKHLLFISDDALWSIPID